MQGKGDTLLDDLFDDIVNVSTTATGIAALAANRKASTQPATEACDDGSNDRLLRLARQGQLPLLFEMLTEYTDKMLSKSQRKSTCPAANRNKKRDRDEVSPNEVMDTKGRQQQVAEDDEVEEEVVEEGTVEGFCESLNKIRQQLKKAVGSYGSIQETTYVPKNSKVFTENQNDVPTYEVDSFLYDATDLDELVGNGLVHREYCTKCRAVGSVAPTQFTTHSFSREQLVFLFCYALPEVVEACGFATPFDDDEEMGKKKKELNTILDVGSRFGIVMGAAYFGSPIPKIIGIEFNEQLVHLQRKLVRLNRMQDRVEVVHGDALAPAGLQRMFDTDIVVLHNVFEWFAEESAQREMWCKVQKAISRPGQVIVASPSLEESISPFFMINSTTTTSSLVLKQVRDWVTEFDLKETVQRYREDRSVRVADASDEDGNVSDGEEEEEETEMAKAIHIYIVK